MSFQPCNDMIVQSTNRYIRVVQFVKSPKVIHKSDPTVIKVVSLVGVVDVTVVAGFSGF